jgi:hypothetical protein
LNLTASVQLAQGVEILEEGGVEQVAEKHVARGWDVVVMLVGGSEVTHVDADLKTEPNIITARHRLDILIPKHITT